MEIFLIIELYDRVDGILVYIIFICRVVKYIIGILLLEFGNF